MTRGDLSPCDLHQFNKILESFPCVTESDRSYVQRAAHRMRLTLAYLPRGQNTKKLLDVGSMRGLFAPAYIELWHYSDVVLLGNDLTDEVARTVGDRAYKFHAVNCNIEIDRWPFPDETFDTVMCTEVLEHLIFDPAFAMNEMCRVLKTGGHALITVPNVAADVSFAQLINDLQPGFLRNYILDALRAGRRDLDTVYNLGHFHEYTNTELRKLALATGFSIERLQGLPIRPQPFKSKRIALVLKLIRILFPHAKRIRESHILALLKKERYTPLNNLPERYPAPLYRPLDATS